MLLSMPDLGDGSHIDEQTLIRGARKLTEKI